MALQTIEFQRAISIFRPDKVVFNHAVASYKQFLANNELASGAMPCLAEISVFVAEVSQEIKDLKGRRFSQIGLAMSRLLGHCVCLESTLRMLANYIKHATLEQQNRTEIEQYLAKAQASYQFMLQFEQYINLLQLNVADTNSNSQYAEVFVELAWMLYIDSKENFLRSDFLTITNSVEKQKCLLASIFYFMIRYSLEYIHPAQLKDQKNVEKRVMVGKILEFVLDVFSIQNIELYKKIAAQFDQYAINLINELIFRTVGNDTDFFSPLVIRFNYKQIQNRYQKSLRPKDIDFRVFRKQYSITPIHKQALFYRVGKKKQENLTRSMTRDYKSHRILDYEEHQSSHIVQANNPQKLTNSITYRQQKSTSFCGSLSHAVNLQVYRYSRALTKSGRKLNPAKKQSAQNAIKKLATRIHSDSALSRQSLELTVYWVYEGIETQILSNCPISEEVSMCHLAISFYLVEEIYGQRCHSKSIVAYLENISSQTLISLWSSLDFLIALPIKSPVKLLQQFQNQKEEIICCLIWNEDTFIDQLAQLAANFQKQEKFVKFSEGLIIYAEQFLWRLGQILNLPPEVYPYAYNCFKFILSSNGKILKNRHIDQILLCSVYIGGKISSNQILFVEIKEAYELLNKENPAKSESVFNQVLLVGNQVGDIIALYNTQFLQTIQPFVPYMANPSLALFHSLFQRQISTCQNLACFNKSATSNMNDLSSQKSKPLQTKTNIEKLHGNIGIFIQAERNQTRVRIRPTNFINTQLCLTEKGQYQANDPHYILGYQ